MTHTIRQATVELATLLRDAPVVAAWRDAQAQFDKDREAQDLVRAIGTLQATLARLNRAGREVPEKHVEALRDMQKRAQDHPTVARLLQTQRQAQEFVAKVRQEISSMLGVDFGALTSSGCC